MRRMGIGSVSGLNSFEEAAGLACDKGGRGVGGLEILRRRENSSWSASATLVERLGDTGVDLSAAAAGKSPRERSAREVEEAGGNCGAWGRSRSRSGLSLERGGLEQKSKPRARTKKKETDPALRRRKARIFSSMSVGWGSR
jgi:hypothetical protein